MAARPTDRLRCASARRSSALLALLALSACACEREPPPGAEADPTPSASAAARAGKPVLPSELARSTDAGAEDATPDAPYEGPYFAATRSSVGVYASPSFERERKMGYMRSGGRTPVLETVTKKDNCSGGWYQVITGGYVCGRDGTTDLDSPKVKFTIKRPNMEEVLPYKYARNAKNGTPLYKTVPTPDQMREYEPYLSESKKNGDGKSKKKSTSTSKKKSKPKPARSDGGSAPTMRLLADGGALADAAPTRPWWRRDGIEDKLHEVSLEELSSEADDILAKRMVKGFYVAVDKHFNWNGRPWYKTTKGLVAPADRFWVTKGSEFQGVEIGKKIKLPVGWTYGWQKKRSTYEIDEETKKTKPASSLGRFELVQLTGKEIKIGKRDYVEMTDGEWIRKHHVRITRPGPPPADIGPKERWIDINLSTQTLVAFRGTQPVFATLISSGKKHKDKAKDHRTPTGEWRIREKHITTTMDGDGTAAGDLPYSIEDVPYVMYFYRSYAVHGAFWHKNYGIRMSHGCVNLAPLDSKYLFFFTEPRLPEGWHGVWSSETRPGSRVVVHE